MSLDVRSRLSHQKDGHYVVVAGINPTPAGEGEKKQVAVVAALVLVA